MTAFTRRTLLKHSATQAAWLAVASPLAALAQDKYPSKPITWVCPYAAGGNADSRSRQVAKVMSTLLGQPIIVDNKAGAGGNIGTEIIARAKPDGYTIGM
ncbi:MAG: Bug family tripartite tricarboxylate transporter substrate binding protein, partial [Limnohabitans sp.]